ncbi:MAG: hypothetical protein GY803_11150 [Chloroflexi bacterium]|nr:hypothetical protein [Chloroflexota bacterium]
MSEPQSENINYLIEEYKALNHEIDQNSRDVFTVLEVSLTATLAIFTVAFTGVAIESYRWLCLLIPWLILFPSTLLITQRVRHSWIIGRYIQIYHEPRLNLNWETKNYNRKMQQMATSNSKGWRERWATFADGTTGILLVTQVVCVVFSFIVLLPILLDQATSQDPISTTLKIIFFSIWFALSVLIFASIPYQRKQVARANDPKGLMATYYPEFQNE